MKTFLLSALLMLTFYPAFCQVTAKDTAKGNLKRGLSVGPLLMEFKLDRGQTSKQTLYFVNNKDKTYNFTFTLDDFDIDSTGSFAVLDSSKGKHALSSWISLDKNFLEIGPGERKTLEITVSVPDNEEAVKSMRWTKVMATNATEKAGEVKEKGNIIHVDKAITVSAQIFQTPPNLTKDLKMVSFKQLNDSVCSIKVKNTGETMLGVDFSIEFSSPDMDEKKKVQRNDLSMLPGQTIIVNLKNPADLPKGKYTAIALADAGEDVSLEAAQMAIEIK